LHNQQLKINPRRISFQQLNRHSALCQAKVKRQVGQGKFGLLILALIRFRVISMTCPLLPGAAAAGRARGTGLDRGRKRLQDQGKAPPPGGREGGGGDQVDG
jgi:hypothetical protein